MTVDQVLWKGDVMYVPHKATIDLWAPPTMTRAEVREMIAEKLAGDGTGLVIAGVQVSADGS